MTQCLCCVADRQDNFEAWCKEYEDIVAKDKRRKKQQEQQLALQIAR